MGWVGKGQIPLPGASVWDREQKAGDFFFLIIYLAAPGLSCSMWDLVP